MFLICCSPVLIGFHITHRLIHRCFYHVTLRYQLETDINWKQIRREPAAVPVHKNHECIKCGFQIFSERDLDIVKRFDNFCILKSNIVLHMANTIRPKETYRKFLNWNNELLRTVSWNLECLPWCGCFIPPAGKVHGNLELFLSVSDSVGKSTSTKNQSKGYLSLDTVISSCIWTTCWSDRFSLGLANFQFLLDQASDFWALWKHFNFSLLCIIGYRFICKEHCCLFCNIMLHSQQAYQYVIDNLASKYWSLPQLLICCVLRSAQSLQLWWKPFKFPLEYIAYKTVWLHVENRFILRSWAFI